MDYFAVANKLLIEKCYIARKEINEWPFYFRAGEKITETQITEFRKKLKNQGKDYEDLSDYFTISQIDLMDKEVLPGAIKDIVETEYSLLCAHPHVIRPWQWLQTGDRRVFVHYSSGNFLSSHADSIYNQGELALLHFDNLARDLSLTSVDIVKICTRYLPESKKFFVTQIGKSPSQTDKL